MSPTSSMDLKPGARASRVSLVIAFLLVVIAASDQGFSGPAAATYSKQSELSSPASGQGCSLPARPGCASVRDSEGHFRGDNREQEFPAQDSDPKIGSADAEGRTMDTVIGHYSVRAAEHFRMHFHRFLRDFQRAAMTLGELGEVLSCPPGESHRLRSILSQDVARQTRFGEDHEAAENMIYRIHRELDLDWMTTDYYMAKLTGRDEIQPINVVEGVFGPEPEQLPAEGAEKA
jgi:hypothetical protein